MGQIRHKLYFSPSGREERGGGGLSNLQGHCGGGGGGEEGAARGGGARLPGSRLYSLPHRQVGHRHHSGCVFGDSGKIC
jgi:hypothetical protein